MHMVCTIHLLHNIEMDVAKPTHVMNQLQQSLPKCKFMTLFAWRNSFKWRKPYNMSLVYTWRHLQGVNLTNGANLVTCHLLVRVTWHHHLTILT